MRFVSPITGQARRICLVTKQAREEYNSKSKCVCSFPKPKKQKSEKML